MDPTYPRAGDSTRSAVRWRATGGSRRRTAYAVALLLVVSLAGNPGSVPMAAGRSAEPWPASITAPTSTDAAAAAEAEAESSQAPAGHAVEGAEGPWRASARSATAMACPPVDAFNHWLVSSSNAGGVNDAGDNFGAAAAVGDFNGDGFGDVAVGAPQDAVSGVPAGAVYVFPGSAAGIASGVRLTQSNAGRANESGDEFGAALAAGDFNRDGRADLAVGVPGEAIGSASDSGAVMLFAGSASGLTTGSLKDQAPGANEAGDGFGRSLAVGDFNSDTYPDLVAGAPGEAPGSNPAGGAVFVFNGSATGLGAAASKTQENAAGNTEAGDRFGQAVAAGDVSGDGIADLVVGAPSEAPNADPAGGAIYVLPGSTGGLVAGYYRTQENGGGNTEAGDNFGAALAMADFNGDGVADIAVGTPNEGPGSDPAGGIFYVFRGVSGAQPSGYFVEQPAAGGVTEAGDGFGAALAAADTDGDGYAELVVGAPSDRLGAGARAGGVTLFGGGTRSPERARWISQADLGSGDETGDRFGAALAAGDVTGDGRPDLVLGTPGEAIPGQPAAGAIRLVSGLSGGISIGPLVGAPTDGAVRLWARGNRPGTLRVQYRATGTPAWTTATAEVGFNSAADNTAVLTLTGLAPATSYDFRLAVDCVVDPLSKGTFRTVPAPSTTGRVRLAFGADLTGTPFTGLANVAAKNPDLMLFGGDNVYADADPAATTTAGYYGKYRNQWGEAYFRKLTAKVPSLMMWDDHEITNDWSGGQTGLYLQARPAFDAYQGSHNPPPRTAGNTYFSLRAGPADIYVLDTRSHRSPNSAADNASKTMLGATQKADLKAWLSASTAPFKFIVSSVPFNDFGGTGNDSWRGFTTERGELFRYIRDNRIGGVVLASGDQHWSGAFRNTSFPPYQFHEFMPSPLWAFFLPPPTTTDPQILFKVGNRKVYAIFDIDAIATPPRLTVEYFDTTTNESLYRTSLTPDQISPTDKPTLSSPDTLHSNGADLSWSRYAGELSGGPFTRYEVHRSATANFTPSPDTLLMSTSDIATTTYRDTTAAPGGTFSYRVVANAGVSNEVRVTLPPDGQATKLLQPDPAAAKDTKLFYQLLNGAIQCGTYGTENWLRVGSDDASTTMWRSLVRFDLKDIPAGTTITSANMSLWKIASNVPATVNAYRVGRDWEEGTYGCFNGATWYTAANGVNWTAQGGDYDPALVASRTVAAGEGPGWHDFDVKTAVQPWVNGDKPNLGLLLRVGDESRTVKNDIDYASSDATASAADITHHPKLAITYVDNSHATKPNVSIAAPAAGAIVRGTAPVTTAASDDRRVDKVELFVDGVLNGMSTTAPYTFSWNTTTLANGSHTLTVKAYDDAGNVTTSVPVPVQVANHAAPTTAITSPANNAVGLIGTVSVTTANTVASGLSIGRVELYVDGALYATSTTAPYTFAWNTLDAALPAYDGAHALSTKVYDSTGQSVSSGIVTATTGNTAGTPYRATFTSSPVPQAMLYTPGGPQLTYPVDVTVTNTSTQAWTSNQKVLRYQWYSPNPADPMVESGNLTALNLAAGASTVTPVRVSVTPPVLPDGVDAAQYRLRFEVVDTALNPAVAFAGKGNQPLDNPVVVNKALSTKLGIEQYYAYVTTPVGAGMTNAVNVANGNSMLTLTPLSNPGRGLHTLTRLTYNSLEQKSESPVGTNFSLSISSLVRLGNPLDVHPNNADTIAGRSNKFVEFVDGDGTLHHFDGTTAGDGSTYWTEPAGTHLFLRSLTTDTTNPRYWALTRPDRVTFYFNADGYPTFVSDRNGNTISFTLTAVAPGDDPGGPKFHITKVTDAAGQGPAPAPNRSFDITYFTKATAKKPQIRGKISRITDHLGHAAEFAYYDDGNLLSITEKGGTNADGTALADRSWIFTYTTSNGAGPAIPDPAQRVAPDPKTPNQASLVYSVRDPMGAETRFAYHGPGTAQNRWKLASVTDRSGAITNVSYDITNRVTTVAAPTPAGQTARTTKFAYDVTGKPLSITNPLNEVTALEWNADFKVTKLTEPNLSTRRFVYNDNGYLTDSYDQLNNHTVLTYQNVAVDTGDVAGRWKPGRTIPHISQLATKQDPVEVAAGSANRWSFGYDANGNVTTVTEPLYPTKPARYTYNADGTVATSADFKGNVSRFTAYDANGLPTTVVDASDSPTTPTHPVRMQFDDGGRLLWVQDANHASFTGGDPRQYRTYFGYDSFNRLGRQSTPKSTGRELGQLIFTDSFYDANDNVVKAVQPHFGALDSGAGPTTTVTYDAMDRRLVVTGPDTTADPAGERTRYAYDVAGRVTTVTLPLGMKDGTPNNTRTVNLTYDALDRVIRQTRNHVKPDATIEALVQHSCYDNVGNLVSTTEPKAALATVTCPASHTTPFTTVYGYDLAHRLTSVSDPLSHNTTFGYDANSSRTTVTDAAGNPNTTRYDALNRPVRIEQRFVAGTNPRDSVTLVEYDENSNTTRVISPRGYDASADKVTFTAYVTSYTYDALNRQTRVNLPLDSTYPTQFYVHRGYDFNGNLTVTTLPDSHPNLVDVPTTARTTVEYFDPGWIAASNDPANPKVHFDYNASGQQTLRTPEDRNGNLDTTKQIQWLYFADGLLRQRTDQQGQPVTYTYNADNQLVSSRDASGLTTPAETFVDLRNAYDDLDRLLRADHKKQNDSAWTFSAFTYDANSNITDIESNGKESTPGGTVTQAGRKQHTDYDQANWITTQLDFGTSTGAADDQRTTNTFSPVGRQILRRIEQNNGSGVWSTKQTTTWDYFANGLLRTLNTTNGSGTVTESHVVDYLDTTGVFVNGNRTKDVFSLRPGGGGTSPCFPGTCTATYAYDPRDRLVGTNDGHGKTTAYTLDGTGNILTEAVNGATTKTYTYTGNQLQQVTGGGTTSKYWYDDVGRLACVTTAAGSAADCAPPQQPAGTLIADYSYDYLDRLSTYRAFSGGTQTDSGEYTHDALDRVVAQVETHPAFPTDPRTTTFNYLGLTAQQTREVQTNSTGTLAAKDYSYDPAGRRLAMTNTPYSGGVPQAPTTYTYGYDTHGSTSQLLDPTGATRASYGYRAYGDTDTDLSKGDTNAVNPFNPFRYSAKRMDTGSNTLDMGARRFGPDIGRFLNQDVFHGALANLGLATDPLTNNRYALAAGNPISYAEWDGHMPIPDGGGSSGSTSGGTSQCYDANDCVATGSSMPSGSPPSYCATLACAMAGPQPSTPAPRINPGTGSSGGGVINSVCNSFAGVVISFLCPSAKPKEKEKEKTDTKRPPIPVPWIPGGGGGGNDGDDNQDCLNGTWSGNMVQYFDRKPTMLGEYRAAGGQACYTSTPPTGTETSSRVKPPGYVPGINQAGHIIAKRLGGSGTNLNNLVPVYRQANIRMRDTIESTVYNHASANETTYYRVDVVYGGPWDNVPDYLRFTVTTSANYFMTCSITNSAIPYSDC